MPVVRQQTQVHDGFATIRSRGLYRSRSRAENYERYRTVSLKSDFNYGSNNGTDNSDIYLNTTTYSEPLYTNHSQHYVTFRPPVPSALSDYQNAQQITRTSFESLKNGRNSRTPDSTLGESASSFSNNDGSQSGSIRDSLSSSMHEANSPPLSLPSKYSLELQDLSQNSRLRRPPLRSNTLSYRRTTSCTDSPLSVYEPKKTLDFYSPTTNYYRPSDVTNRCSSAENLEHGPTTSSWHRTCPEAGITSPATTAMNMGERRYHTLGHTRGRGKDTKSLPYDAQTSIKSWESSNFNANEYADPLDWKIGCQTTLRSKPLIPWYELATMRGGSNRRSCPPFEVFHFNFFFVVIYFFQNIELRYIYPCCYSSVFREK